MAIIKNNPLVKGVSGMLGRTIVFKNLRGKTVIANYVASTKKRSEQQQKNSQKFKAATVFAKTMMLDPAKKEYYRKKARKLKLPNAYTAAITDYMRSVEIKNVEGSFLSGLGDQLIIVAGKKGFALAEVRVRVKKKDETVDEGIALRTVSGYWAHTTRETVSVGEKLQIEIHIRDGTGRVTTHTIRTKL